MIDPGVLETIEAVALDVDGTIAGGDHRVSPRTRAAIGALVELGLPVFLLTGRARANVLALAREVGIANAVASNNGSVEFDPVADRNLVVRPMGHGLVNSLLDLGVSLGLETTWWTTDEIFVDRFGECARTLEELNERDIQLGDRRSLPAQVTKVMYFGSKQALDGATAQILGDFPEAFRSMDSFFEFVAPGADKWAALASMLDRVGVRPQHCLGLGDGGNDVGWLSRIGLPLAMGNARPEVIEVAAATVGDHKHDGAAQALEQLAQAKRGRGEVPR